MKNDITLLIGTCDRYNVLWENFMILADKYFKVDCPRLFVSEDSRVPSADYDTYKGKKLPWSNRIAGALDTVKTKYVFLLLDDYYLREAVTEDDISTYIEFLDRVEGNKMMIAPYDNENAYTLHDVVYDDKYFKLTNDSKYQTAIMPSIIRTDWFRDSLIPNQHIWDVETEGNLAIQGKDNKIYLDKKEFPGIAPGIVRQGGKLIDEWRDVFEKENLPKPITRDYEEPVVMVRQILVTDGKIDSTILSDGKNMLSVGIQETLNELRMKLERESKVCYVRFGDGDFNIMSNSGRCIEHDYSPELQTELLESFRINEPNYLRGAMVNEPTFNGQTLIDRRLDENEAILEFIDETIDDKEFKLYSHVLLTFAAICNQPVFVKFLDTFIRPKKKMFIGSVDKESIEKLVGPVDYYVKIPVAEVDEQGVFRGAYYSIDEWWPKVLENIEDVDLVLPTAGMAGRVACKRIWNLDVDVHCIELGSIVDAVIDKESRGWIARTDKNLIQNLLVKEPVGQPKQIKLPKLKKV